MSWREDKPTGSDIPNSDLADLFRSQKTHFSAYVGKHFFWNDSSNASAGIPRLSDGSPGPGSAHAFYGTASQVSHVSAGGKLMLTSDTSRFYGLHSAQSTLLGSPSAIVYGGGSVTTITPGTRWLVQSGSTFGTVVAARNFNLVFPIPYTATAPFVETTPIASAATLVVTSGISTTAPTTASGASVTVVVRGGNTSVAGFYWRSVGTVNL